MITAQEIRTLFDNGISKQNTGLVQLLGLCPLLAISNNIVNALSLGLATMLVMAASSGAVSGVRHFVPHEIRIPVFVLIIAALVTVIDLAMNVFVHPLYLVLGIFIPLITTNCIVLARADAFAAKNHPLHSVIDAIAMGLGLTLVLVVLGAIRELAGQGTLLSGIDLVFGAEARQFVLHVLPGYQGFLLAILPPGAFIALGLLIAVHNWRHARAEQRPRGDPGCSMKPPLKKRVPKSRNPYVPLALARKAGEHDQSTGARRQAEKRALKKRLAEQ